MVHIRVEYHSTIKRKESESVLVRWTNLDPVIQSEEREKQVSYINAYMEWYR